jgi:hypothetical protein
MHLKLSVGSLICDARYGIMRLFLVITIKPDTFVASTSDLPCSAWIDIRLVGDEGSNLGAGIAQLGERQTEDLKVACSIHAHRIKEVFYVLEVMLFGLSFQKNLCIGGEP